MKTKCLLLILLISVLGYAQPEMVTVHYRSVLSDDKDQFGSFMFDKGTLISSNMHSIYIETPRDTVVNLNYLGDVSTAGSKYQFQYYKDLESHVLITNRNYGMNKLIKDENYKISWTLTGGSKKVLSYDCKEATCEFRGRQYRAYYLESIAIPNGPFKFDGLPGLILDVESTDGSVSITATDITYDEGDVSNPFENIEVVNWGQFISFYREKFDRITSINADDTEMIIPNRYIECFLKE